MRSLPDHTERALEQEMLSRSGSDSSTSGMSGEKRGCGSEGFLAKLPGPTSCVGCSLREPVRHCTGGHRGPTLRPCGQSRALRERSRAGPAKGESWTLKRATF